MSHVSQENRLTKEAGDYGTPKCDRTDKGDPIYTPNLPYSLGFTLAWPPRLPPLRDNLKSAAEELFTGGSFRPRRELFSRKRLFSTFNLTKVPRTQFSLAVMR